MKFNFRRRFVCFQLLFIVYLGLPLCSMNILGTESVQQTNNKEAEWMQKGVYKPPMF